MLGASKILTVSYGTFSCTLEGFDDPFSTMKGIAEYFRDLAADDRYFGAEPPTPDAAMLQRIAEREVQRRVEAKINKTGVVLRQTGPSEPQHDTGAPMVADATPAAAAAADDAELSVADVIDQPAAIPAAVPAAAEEVIAEAAPVADVSGEPVWEDAVPDVRVTPIAAAATAPATPVQAEDDSVAAKLARIRAAVAAARVAAEAAPAALASAAIATVETAAPADADLIDAAYDDEDGAEVAAEGAPAQDFTFDLDLSDAAVPAPVAEPAETQAIDLEAYGTADAAETADPAEVSEAADDPDLATVEADDLDDLDDLDDEVPSAEDADHAEAIGADAYDIPDLAALDGVTPGEIAAASAGSDAVDDLPATEVLTSDDALLSSLAALTEGAPAEEPAEETSVDPTMAEAALQDVDASVADIVGSLSANEEAEPTTAEADEVAAEDAGIEFGSDAAADDLTTDEAGDETLAEDGGTADEIDLNDDRVLAVLGEFGVSSDGDDITAAIRDLDLDVVTAAEEDAGLAAADTQDADADFVADADADADAYADVAVDPAAEAGAPRPGFLQRARARVIKVRASDFIPGDADDGSTPRPAAALSDDGGLSEEDEADLIAELERAERDLMRAAVGESEAEGGRAILEGSGTGNEDAVSRLMDEANTKLDGAESRRRFSAIAHLKAAVAATVADRKMKSKDAPAELRPVDDDVTDRYREDLSKAVRPRRPSSDAATMTQRPSVDLRPAPLVLVSEQRIDRSASQNDAGAIRPRRVIAAAQTVHPDDADLDLDEDIVVTPEDAKNFADFAEKLGASNLPELLEAAAAYTATVEGRPHFSRPQILSKVANVAEDDDYTREDGLRSFGMLLRQGKIQKVRRGQFMIADTSKFMTEAHRAAR